MSPSGVSGISAVHLRTCRSLDEIWIFRVGPPLNTDGQKDPKPRKLILFESFLGILPLNTRFFFHHLVPQSESTCLSKHLTHWNSRVSLWNPRYSEKGDWPEHFSSTASRVMPFSHESEHTKLMTWLIIKAEVSRSFITTTVREQRPRSHHKGATGRVRTGDQRYPVLCHCQLGQEIPYHWQFSAGNHVHVKRSTNILVVTKFT